MHQIQMATETHLFQQAVNMSGSPLMMKPLPGFVAEQIYQTVIDILGLQDLPVKKRVNTLATISASELLSKLPAGLPFLPVMDNDVLKEDISFSGLESGSKVGVSRQITLLIGSCDTDVRIAARLFHRCMGPC